LVSLQQIGYVIQVSCEQRELSVHFVFTHRNLVSSTQIAWVLYGQASRAISIG
jgi:hypothetical protein